MSEDAVLVSRICCGDMDAFEALYDKYKRPLYRAALAISGDHGAAEEILQDTFVRAYAAMGRVDTSMPLSPWLHRIVVNLSYNWASRNRQPAVRLDELFDRLLASPTASPEHVAESTELCEIVRQAVASLAVKQRVVVVLYYLQGLSMPEIAYALDCPVGTVKSRLHYACKALRQRLKGDRRLVGEVAYVTF